MVVTRLTNKQTLADSISRTIIHFPISRHPATQKFIVLYKINPKQLCHTLTDGISRTIKLRSDCGIAVQRSAGGDKRWKVNLGYTCRYSVTAGIRTWHLWVTKPVLRPLHQHASRHLNGSEYRGKWYTVGELVTNGHQRCITLFIILLRFSKWRPRWRISCNNM